MNAPGQSHPQGPFPGGMPSQQQNMGLPRGGQNASQNASKQPNLPGSRGQYAFANEQLLDPQLSLWTLAKPAQATSWEDVEPEQLCVSRQEVERRMAKFHRKGEEPSEVLINMKSQSARKAVKELVFEQNEELWKYNPTIRYYIASIQVDKEVIKHWPDKGKKRIKRIDIILKTEPRPLHEIPKAFLDAMQPPKPSTGGKDPSTGGQGGMGQGGAQGGKGNQPQGPGGFQNQPSNMPPQGNRPPPGQGPSNGPPHNQNYGPPQGPNFGPPGGAAGIPPPPPPPNGPPGPHGQGAAMPPPPPPPTGPPRQPPGVHPQGVPPPPPPPPTQMPQQPPMPQPVRPMPGAFPGPNPQPRVEVLDPNVLRAQKKPKGPRRDSGESSESETDFSDISVDGFRYVERSRSRGRDRDDRRRSRSRSQHRNRSHDRGNVFKSYKEKRAYGRPRSDIESPPRDRHNNPSPNSSNPALPPQNIFNIKIDNEKERSKTKGHDGHKRPRDPRRATHSNSPTGFPAMPYRVPEKYQDKYKDPYAGEAMYRSGSNNGSDSESSYADSSSIYTSSDRSIFSEPDHYPKQMPIRPQRMQHHRDDGFVQPPFDYDPRGAPKHHYPGANDYPPQRTGNRSPQFDDHIMPPASPPWPRPAQPQRRHTQPNPFEAGPRYGGGYGGYGHEQPRYLADREHDMDLEDLFEKWQQQRRGQGNLGRRGSARVPARGLGMAADTDEWADRGDRFGRARARYGGY